MEPEAFTPLVEARIAAEERCLSGVLDAYETFCAYGYFPDSWKLLAAHLTLYLESDYPAKPRTKQSLTFRSEISFASYLETLDDEQLGFLASDAVVALFHLTAVFDTSQHLERNSQTSCFDLLPWEKPQGSQAQKLVRTYFQGLQDTDLYLLIEGITQQLYAKTYRVQQFSSSWTPCSGSHLDILPRLDPNVLPHDTVYLQDNVDYIPPSTEAILHPASIFLERATSRATSFLGSPRRSLLGGTNLPSLFPLMEDTSATAFTQSARDLRGSSNRDSKPSSFSDYRSFITALTHRTGSSVNRFSVTGNSRRSLATASTADKKSTIQTFVSWPTSGTHADDMANLSQWSSTLRQRDIIPDPELENWSSGRGQHAEYLPIERDLIPLIVENILGQTSTALVESVRCMRVRLVRKLIRCNKRTQMNRDDVLQEVQQLYRAQHSHIVRLVGTYVVGDDLAIHTYPCAEWNLEQFLAIPATALGVAERTQALCKFFTCLAKTLDFIHSLPIKHMDIKPQNILVRYVRHSSINGTDPFKIYLTNFGSSRFYPSIADTETDSLTPFTRAYAAQEVILQERRGLSADIFSMGCVYAQRPSALQIADDPQLPLVCRNCALRSGPEQFEAANSLSL